jgi:hypothetical protein
MLSMTLSAIPAMIRFPIRQPSGGLIVETHRDWRVKPYMLEKKVNYTIVLGDKKMGDLYGLFGMPMTHLIDRDGKIAKTYLGLVDKNNCEQEIRTLVQENARSLR